MEFSVSSFKFSELKAENGSSIVWNAEHCSAWKSEGKFEPSDARRSV
jgi:hypothetical protein